MRSPARVVCATALGAALLVQGGPAPASGSQPVFGVTMTRLSDLPKAEFLAGADPFVVRVPFVWMDAPDVEAERKALVAAALDHGWRVTANLRYRTVPDDAATDPLGGFRAWVSVLASEMSGMGEVFFEIANRPNPLVPDADADPLAVQALVAGVVSASEAAPSSPVGFSWLASGVPVHDAAWWATLGTLGGRTLPEHVGFVGVQLFPGSQGPWTPWAAGGPRTQVRDTIRDTRLHYMGLAGLGSSVHIDVGEFGASMTATALPYSNSDPDVEHLLGTPSAQARTLAAIAEGIRDAAGWGVRGAAWTLLADEGPCFAEQCWGLVDRFGSERPAFGELRFQVYLSGL